MKKEEIVEKFLEQGLLLSPKFLETLTEESIEKFSFTNTTENIVIQTLENQKHILKSASVKMQAKLTPKDFIEFNKNKYETLKSILSQKTKPISIDKCKQNTEVNIIAFVIDRTPSGYLVEDPTKKIEIKTAENLLLNSVLGFSGKIKEDVFYVEKVFFPDIPLDNDVKTFSLILHFTEKGNQKKADITITLEEKEAENVLSLSNPGQGNIDNIRIISYKPKSPLKREDCIKFLKYRFIPEDNPNQNFLMKKSPDIFWVAQEDEWIENYKGVTIISSTDMLFDMKTRSKL